MLRNIITRKLVSVPPTAKIPEVAKLMEQQNVGAVLIQDGGKAVGIVTDRDIALSCQKGGSLEGMDVGQFVSPSKEIATVKETEGLFDCIRKMRQAKVRRMPVVDDSGKVVAVLSFGDVLALLSRELNDLAEAATPGIAQTKNIAA